jgi:ElaB/YqjD/DUF883 family membrane-anchored ribosome-binding protein
VPGFALDAGRALNVGPDDGRQDVMTESVEPAQVRADIARHRADLADTVEQLAAKVDVKARARKGAAAATEQAKEALSTAVDEVKDAGRAAVDQFNGPVSVVARRPVPWALVAFAVAGAAVGWLVWRRRS